MTKKRNLLIILAVSVSIVIGGFVFMKNFNNDTINAENSSPEGIAQNVIDAENSSPEGTALKVIDEATTVPEVVLPTKSPDYLKSSELILNGISGGIPRESSGMTREQLVEKLGQPKNIEKLDYYPHWFYYDYGDVAYLFTPFYEQPVYLLSSIEIKGKTAQAPRDIKVGDKFDDVLNKFPQERDYKTSEHGIFYGTSQLFTNVGLVGYERGGQTITIVTEIEDSVIKIYFNNGVVSDIHITFARLT